MAFGAKKIFPLDRRPSVAIGFSLPFSTNQVFSSTYLTKDAIRYNLINYFLTNQGERPLNPTFGADLRKFIFTQINDNSLDFIKEDIQSKINLYFPNVIINNLELLSSPDENQINIKLFYQVKDTGITDNIEISFN